MINTPKMLYFFNSSQFVNERNESLARVGKKFDLGTVVSGGQKIKYAYKGTDKKFLKMYPDAELVAEGYSDKIQYTETKNIVGRKK